MESKKAQIIIRVPEEMWRLLKVASCYGKISMNQLALEALEARRKHIEKKYLIGIDTK
jgi:predicted HicB family RNase H-like nuclease